MSAPDERGAQSAAAARYSEEAKSVASESAAASGSAGSDSSKPGSATATVAAKRQCVCCGQATPANAANCVHCGEFLGTVSAAVPVARPGASTARRYEEFEEDATPGANLVARLAGLVMMLAPIGGFVYDAKTKVGDNAASPVMIGSMLALAIFGIPGLYIAIKGALGGSAARRNRSRGMAQLVIGIGMILLGGVLTVIVSWIGVVLGVFAVAFVGLAGVGAVNAALGFVSVISGRNLLVEMNEINLFGGDK